MFKLQPNPTFKTKVAISVAGEKTSPSIEIEFKYMSRETVKQFFENITGKTDADSLAEIIVGWNGVSELYSPEALSILIDNYPAASTDLFEAFRRELLESKRKN